MGGGTLGYIIGGVLVSLLLPCLILIAAKFVGPMKRNPKVVYSVCAMLVLVVCALGPSVSGLWVPAAISAGLALLVLWVGYRRDTKVAP